MTAQFRMPSLTADFLLLESQLGRIHPGWVKVHAVLFAIGSTTPSFAILGWGWYKPSKCGWLGIVLLTFFLIFHTYLPGHHEARQD